MKNKIAFFLGFLISLTNLFLWQKAGFSGLSTALGGKNWFISPLIVSFPSDRAEVLSESDSAADFSQFNTLPAGEKIFAQGAYAYDLTAQRVIFDQNSRKRLQAASTVKIVTAAVALDKGKLDELLTVNYFPTVVGESSMNLVFSDKLTLKELLYGLLLVSGNDAAETIAQGLAGKREVFIEWMNEFAQKVGAKNTHFTTPSGLDEDGQYTTAYDLFLLGKNVFEQYPIVAEISTTREKIIPESADHRSYYLRNELLILDSFPIIGGKPGLGEGNLYSLVALLKKDDRRILVILIRTPTISRDLEQILKIS